MTKLGYAIATCIFLALAGVFGLIGYSVFSVRDTPIDGPVVATSTSDNASSTIDDSPEEGSIPSPLLGEGIRIGQTLAVPEGNIRVTALNSDSRCPKDVTCVWAGEVVLEIAYETNEGTATGTLRSGTPLSLGIYTITLVDVSPQSKEGGVALDQYRFVLRVEHTPPAPVPTQATTTKARSGVSGTLLAGPTCPVVQEGMDCNEKPQSGVSIVVQKADGAVVAQTTTGSNGKFTVFLAPGDYTIVRGADSPFPSFSPMVVSVRAGKIESIILHGDTGIR